MTSLTAHTLVRQHYITNLCVFCALSQKRGLSLCVDLNICKYSEKQNI